jgi:hypothetical protein
VAPNEKSIEGAFLEATSYRYEILKKKKPYGYPENYSGDFVTTPRGFPPGGIWKAFLGEYSVNPSWLYSRHRACRLGNSEILVPYRLASNLKNKFRKLLLIYNPW